MMNGKKVLAIIPARAGSKRLPNKNILELGGKPLIAWTIESAIASTSIDKVIVSTDSDEIKKVAEDYHAVVPFLRPVELSTDTAASMDVVKHAVTYLRDQGETFDIIVLLQPTSPLRTARHIDDALDFYSNKEAESVVSVVKCEHSPLWSNELPKSLSTDTFIREDIKNKRSQDLPQFFRLNGAIYISSEAGLLKSGSFLSTRNGYAYEMDAYSSVDIDNELDFKFAKFLIDEI